MPAIFEKLDRIRPFYDAVYKIVLFICKILLIADILITTYQVLGRYVPFIDDPAWTEETILTLMSYMAVLSAALAIRRGAHIRMTALDRYLPEGLLKILDILADVAVLGLASAVPAAGRPLSADFSGGGPGSHSHGTPKSPRRPARPAPRSHG